MRWRWCWRIWCSPAGDLRRAAPLAAIAVALMSPLALAQLGASGAATLAIRRAGTTSPFTVLGCCSARRRSKRSPSPLPVGM
ncbi:MAG: hypothetical protein U0521_16255 [Anaerolineae bacterium]